ncbi:MAG: hypothetical protein QXG86_01725 [Candidatus Woesearchaeota archaeon]
MNKKTKNKEKHKINPIETIFFDNRIPNLIEKIRNNNDFKIENFEKLVETEELKTLDSLLTSDTAITENVLYYNIGAVLKQEFFPCEVNYFFETKWDKKGKIIEICKPSPFNKIVKDHQFLNQYNINYDKFKDFRVDGDAVLLSTVNIIKPTKKMGHVREIRLRLKSAGSLAFKITQLLFGDSKGQIYDRMGCKIVCEDSKNNNECYKILEKLKKGIKHKINNTEIGGIIILEPHSKNIEDTIYSPRKGKEDLKMIFVNAVYMGEKIKNYYAPTKRINFRIHIEPASTLELEKNYKSNANHTVYKKKLWEDAQKNWPPEAWNFYHLIKHALDIRY